MFFFRNKCPVCNQKINFNNRSNAKFNGLVICSNCISKINEARNGEKPGKVYLEDLKQIVNEYNKAEIKDGIYLDRSYYKLLNLYNEILNLYKNNFNGCSYKEFNINDFEKVFLIEDSFIIYIGMKFGNEKKLDERGYYPIIFEEFSQNNIFKFSINAFINTLYKKYNSQEQNFQYLYKKFNGVLDAPIKKINIDYYMQNDPTYVMPDYYNSNYKKICKVFPELNLLERYNCWEGFSRNYIIYELKEQGKTGYAVCMTTSDNTNQYAISKEKDLEMCGFEINYKYSKTNKLVDGSYNGLFYDKNMAEILYNIVNSNETWINQKKNLTRKSYLSGKVSYFSIHKFIKADNGFWGCEDVLNELYNEKYNSIERQVFELGEYRWKSEELVLKYVSQIFKNNKVIHQHRPYFLHTQNGQLSYDVFVSGKNIAFEYQGKQHFEPVEIFGGKENFEKQQERDKIKKELSIKNNVKLIYINYWENITKELIIEKLKEIGFEI